MYILKSRAVLSTVYQSIKHRSPHFVFFEKNEKIEYIKYIFFFFVFFDFESYMLGRTGRSRDRACLIRNTKMAMNVI